MCSKPGCSASQHAGPSESNQPDCSDYGFSETMDFCGGSHKRGLINLVLVNETESFSYKRALSCAIERAVIAYT